MQLNFNNSSDKKYNKYQPLLLKLSKKTFKHLKIKDNYIIDLDFVSAAEIKKINKQYRKIDKETDVLSFAFLELKKGEIKIKSKEPQFLGEIIISTHKIEAQAKEFKHTFRYELSYLYLHGLLHLLGYDHVHSEKEKRIMFTLEDKILKGEKL
ncbi:MAG: rRNA maturation RNase YbeY [Bacilli bacterium]|nr:rRNA maturation RNase YbeY [Bacilli bacterium]